MDRAIRNAIERATQQARKLLDDDFSSQLEGTFDVLRDGVIVLQGGSHLSARQQSHRDKITGAIEHKRASGMTAVDAITDYVRDAAFTTLNRFVALKMLEARDLVQECITRGEQSAGYREFCGMAPGVALLPDAAGYRLYIECLFDEFSTEIKVLFDRRDAASVLWPKRPTFESLLAILNAQDLSGVWGEDETIGWVYQFFNSSEERRQMRDESQAPRNSRELAVRNQFFTPRYVVQFLTDNTLGRLWLEMHGEETQLSTICEYLVRSGNEPAQSRQRKDPRDIRILDPACGSGHFLLYSFDLLLTIYAEAWRAPGTSPKSEATGRTLHDEYTDIAELRRASPKLILEHNLHGVDIDARCAQIAALALWLRAQRAWKDLGVVAFDRPRIQRTHIVVAEPMPDNPALIASFAERLEPPLLRDLFRKMVGETQLAGELGTLLPLEDAIASDLRLAREQFVELRQTPAFLPGMEPVLQQGILDLSGIGDDGFFHEAEATIFETLRAFAEAATGHLSVRRRLFVDDAAQGVALIDLVRTRFDVILMNPPFGDAVRGTRDVLAFVYPEAKLDLYACFVQSALNRLVLGGRVGVLSSRLGLFLGSLEDWRSLVLLGESGSLEYLADLGHNVLDGALVEAAAYVIGTATKHDDPWACGLLKEDDKSGTLRNEIGINPNVHRRPRLLALARDLPGRPIPYWLPPRAVQHLVSPGRLADIRARALVGLQTDDDFRFVRLAWEVAPQSAGENGRWRYFAKGGEYSPYYDDIHLVVRWEDNARELRSFIEQRYSWTKNARSAGRYGAAGLTYPERTTSEFSPRPLPEGTIFSIAGPAVLCNEPEDSFGLLAIFYTRWYRLLIEAYVGGGDAVNAGSAARHYKTGIINSLPLPPISATDWERLIDIGRECALSRAVEFSLDETSRLFSGFPLSDGSWQRYCDRLLAQVEDLFAKREELSFQAETIVGIIFRLSKEENQFIQTDYGPHPGELPNVDIDFSVTDLLNTDYSDLCRQLVEVNGFSRQISKLSHWTNKTYEAVAQVLGVSIRSIVQKRRSEGRVPEWWAGEIASRLISYLLGIAFGRWSMATGDVIPELDTAILLRLPEYAPAELGGRSFSADILVDEPGHTNDVASRITRVAESVGFDVQALDHIAGKSGGVDDIRQHLRFTFFSLHISQYSKSRRSAPVYWQIATKSSSYSAWLYLHALSDDTLYKMQNDYIAPKLAHEDRRLTDIVQSLGATPSAQERKMIAAQEDFIEELRVLLEEVKRVTPLWKPTVNDGVVLTMAPLWRLMPQNKAWQKELKNKWDELARGDHDWAHIAMHLWPERVIPRCATDRSLAIAHDIEDVFWLEAEDGKWQPRSAPTCPIDELVRERTSTAVKAALRGLIGASSLDGSKVRKRRLSI